jgi:hypothetical protein
MHTAFPRRASRASAFRITEHLREGSPDIAFMQRSDGERVSKLDARFHPARIMPDPVHSGRRCA